MGTDERYEQLGVAMTCRSYGEYVRMFDLKEDDLAAGEVLDIAAGGSSFAAEMAGRAVAVDPRYAGDPRSWIKEAAEEIGTSTAKLAKLAHAFDWSYYGSLEKHRSGRERSLALFEKDLSSEAGRGRYVAGALPRLPFEDDRFSLVLCSHFLFLYAEQFGAEFHTASVLEMMRVCRPGGQIRIYPLLSLGWKEYDGLETLLREVGKAGGEAKLAPSRLPFIPGSNFYLRIRN